MGADIHFRVEYYAEIETVVVKGGAPTAVGTGTFRWVSAEPLSRNDEIDYYNQMLAAGEIAQDDFDEDIQHLPQYIVAYKDRYYTGRNYTLFGRLSGVRDYEVGSLTGPDGNGLPDDMSPEVADELDYHDGDLHSHSHLTLAELLKADWSAAASPSAGVDVYREFREALERMQDLAYEKALNQSHECVRAVWAFDN